MTSKVTNKISETPIHIDIGDCVGIIYMIVNKIDNRSYVGQTRSYGVRNGKKVNIGLYGRLNQHIWNAENGLDECPALNRAIRKYGKENFIAFEIYNCTIDKLNDTEIEHIALYQTYTPYGYNCTMGGDHSQVSAEQRARMNKMIS